MAADEPRPPWQHCHAAHTGILVANAGHPPGQRDRRSRCFAKSRNDRVFAGKRPNLEPSETRRIFLRLLRCNRTPKTKMAKRSWHANLIAPADPIKKGAGRAPAPGVRYDSRDAFKRDC